MESMTVAEAARRLSVSNHQVSKWIASGLIEVVMMPSGRKRIEPSELERFWRSLPRKKLEVLEVSELLKTQS